MWGRCGSTRHCGIQFAVPGNRRGALAHALLQPAALHDLRLAAAVALAQRGGDRHRVAGAHRILEPELDGVEAQRVRDLLHQAFQGKLGLGRAVAAEGARRRHIGVDHLGVELDVGTAVGGQPAQTGDAADSQPVTAIRARVGDDVHVQGAQGAVLLHAGAIGHDHGMARAGAGELLGAGVLKTHRPAGRNGQVRTEIFDQHLLLAAEAAADARLDHADALDRQPDQRGDHAAHVEGHLGAGADHHALVFVPVGDDDVRLDGCLLHLMYMIGALENMIRRGQPLLHIAVTGVDGDGDVAFDVGHAHRVRLVVDDRRAGLHGGDGVEDRGQHIILDFDQVERSPGDVG